MAHDNLKILEEAGVPLDLFPEDEQKILTELSPEELVTLINIRKKVGNLGKEFGLPETDSVGGVIF